MDTNRGISPVHLTSLWGGRGARAAMIRKRGRSWGPKKKAREQPAPKNHQRRGQHRKHAGESAKERRQRRAGGSKNPAPTFRANTILFWPLKFQVTCESGRHDRNYAPAAVATAAHENRGSQGTEGPEPQKDGAAAAGCEQLRADAGRSLRPGSDAWSPDGRGHAQLLRRVSFAQEGERRPRGRQGRAVEGGQERER